MTEEIKNWIIYFLIYSVLGYISEVSLRSIKEKKLVNRGFLFGPWIPVYGFGMLFVLISTLPVRGNFTLTFFVSMLVCSLLEYFTSWLMEKLFHIRWWDYSKSDKYNLNGRICLRNCLAFGVAGSLIIYQLHPPVETFVASLSPLLKTFIVIIFLIIFLLDFIASTYAVRKVGRIIDVGKIVGDQTNEVKRACRRVIKELFRRKKNLEKKLEKKRKKLERKLKKKYEK